MRHGITFYRMCSTKIVPNVSVDIRSDRLTHPMQGIVMLWVEEFSLIATILYMAHKLLQG